MPVCLQVDDKVEVTEQLDLSEGELRETRRDLMEAERENRRLRDSVEDLRHVTVDRFVFSRSLVTRQRTHSSIQYSSVQHDVSHSAVGLPHPFSYLISSTNHKGITLCHTV